MPSVQMAAVLSNLCRPNFPGDARIAWTCGQAKNEKALTDLGLRLVDVLRFNRMDRLHALQGGYLENSRSGWTMWPDLRRCPRRLIGQRKFPATF